MRCAGGRKGRGRGGGAGKGVRGVDFGLGIGYTPESNNPSPSTTSRSAAVNSLRTGMMAQFKSSFVAASANSQNQTFSNTTSMPANKRPALRGFVSGGSIGGDVHSNQTLASPKPATSAVNTSSHNSGADAGQRNTDRLLSDLNLIVLFFN